MEHFAYRTSCGSSCLLALLWLPGRPFEALRCVALRHVAWQHCQCGCSPALLPQSLSWQLMWHAQCPIVRSTLHWWQTHTHTHVYVCMFVEGARRGPASGRAEPVCISTNSSAGFPVAWRTCVKRQGITINMNLYLYAYMYSNKWSCNSSLQGLPW